MDLVTLLTACALSVDPKLMHALVWHQSGGEPWAISAQGEASPRVYRSMKDAIQEARERSRDDVVRVGLAGVSVPPAKVSASVLLPCRNVAMAADQITKLTRRCKSHPRLKADPILCPVAVYRGSWEQPDIKFATDVAASVAKCDAPNFDMPRGTSTEIFDTAQDLPAGPSAPVIDVTSAFAEQARSWSSALFPPKSGHGTSQPENSTTAHSPSDEPPLSGSPAAFPSASNPQDRGLFVRPAGSKQPR